MTAALIACLVLAVGICAMLIVLWHEERRRRKSVERASAVIARNSRDIHDQVPFPYGEKLP